MNGWLLLPYKPNQTKPCMKMHKDYMLDHMVLRLQRMKVVLFLFLFSDNKWIPKSPKLSANFSLAKGGVRMPSANTSIQGPPRVKS